jgi:hypothetical protein
MMYPVFIPNGGVSFSWPHQSFSDFITIGYVGILLISLVVTLVLMIRTLIR